MSLFANPRVATPPASDDRSCHIFAWIGQPFASCDMCGRPAWRHLYWPPFGGQRPIFHVKQYVGHRDQWEWQAVGKLMDPPESFREFRGGVA